MKTGKHFVLVICGVLHCITSAITMTRVQQYKVEIMIVNYTNPSQSARRQSSNSCRGSNCSCCDGHRDGSGSCSDHCDSSFAYCLRKVDALDGSGCPIGGIILRSYTNYDDRSVDFSQNTVLGLDNPLVFKGLSDTWKGVQLYVRIWDIDPGNSLELIDEVKWKITQDVGVPSGVVNLTGMYEIVTMKVNITVLCIPGFNGTICEENIDDCVGVSCSGNSYCVDGVNSFTCNCNSGFIGPMCNETDECVNVTCSGRGQCVDGVSSYLCDCNAGYAGMMCETDIDDCFGESCSGNGKCMDGVNSFTCNCTSGFTGALCNETNECVNTTCSGRGRCMDGVASYVCDCDAGYTGENCEIKINDCMLKPCGERGQCVDEVDSFICMCNPGFTGELCQINIDDCAGVNCSGNGECADGVNSFTCNCTSGFTGALCNETDECVDVTCSGRGQCVDGVASYVCDCNAGYTGGNCEINIDECLSNSCGEGGQCVDGVNSFICMCNPGFTGKLCRTDIDDCVGVNCNGNGECVDKVNDFTCECSPGYRGPLCAEVSVLHQNPVVPIVGGVLGALATLIFILILMIVVVIIMRGRKRPGKDTQEQPSHVHGDALAGDDPDFIERITSTIQQDPIYTNVQDTKQSSYRDKSESPLGRELDNPINGHGNQEKEIVYAVPDMGSTTHHMFDNPIYGDNTNQTSCTILSV